MGGIGSGRKMTLTGTATVLSKGHVQLSPDLVLTGKIRLATWPKKKVVMLLSAPLLLDEKNTGAKPANGERTIWFANERAQSGRIYLRDALKEIGLDHRQIIGHRYKAQKYGGSVTIYFGRRIK